MTKLDLLFGFGIGLICCLAGVFLFIFFFTDFHFLVGIQIMQSDGNLGKLITLGAILDLIAFGILFKMKKELMARGVVLAVILIAFFTIFA